MTPVDLLDYTRSSKKIPTAFLSPSRMTFSEVTKWTILKSHALDFMAITSLWGTAYTLLYLSMSSFMITRSLNRAFQSIEFSDLSVSFLPLFIMSYYFFSYFFNHGQTWGMSVTGTRVKMSELSFRSSLVWAIYSSSLTMTFGLTLRSGREYFASRGWGTFADHDYLYMTLVQEKQVSPVDLVALSSRPVECEARKDEEEIYLEAA